MDESYEKAGIRKECCKDLIKPKSIIDIAFSFTDWLDLLPMIAGGDPIRASQIVENNVDIRDCIDALKFQIMQMQLYSPAYLLSQMFGQKQNSESDMSPGQRAYLEEMRRHNKEKYGKNS